MGRKRRKQQGWRLGGKEAPPWLRAPCEDAIKARTREDLKLLRDVLCIAKLDPSHALRQLWERDGSAQELSEARFEFHHLAADLRVVADVPGARQLVAAMRSDVEGYHDFRYELRIAGSVGRATGQELLRLAGKDPGPDVEVLARSGHRCGIACYRARSTTPDLRDVGLVTAELASRMGAVAAASPPPVGMQLTIHVRFPRFPVSPEHQTAAMAAFSELWARPDLPSATASRQDVTATRVAVGRASIPLTWEVRLMFHLPVPARERLRLGNHIADKLTKEHLRWAKDYQGIAVLAAEESDFCLGIDRAELEALLRPESEHTFGLLLSTLAFFGNSTIRGQFRMEEIDYVPRVPGAGLKLSLQTFGENSRAYGDGHAVMSWNPSHAEEEWRLLPGAPPTNVAGVCVRPLSIQRRIARTPVPGWGKLSSAEQHQILTDLVGRVRIAPEGS